MTNTAKAEQPETLNHRACDKHSWEVESRHWTSEGEVVYTQCSACVTRHMQLRPVAQQLSMGSHELRL
ncbi:hypothetical protein [Glutamicibacter soli]|uniref:hypothetical protein n=1 Tax=Glutamicibacter soli TaxID=453836 RepID=UPI003FCFFC46